MAKGIKKFDQEIRVVSSILSMNNVTSGYTGSLSSNSANTNGAYYVYSDAPWFANETTTYQLANNADIQAVSSQTWQNDTDIATLSAGTFTFTNGVHSENINFGDTLTLTGGTDITVTWDGSKYEINNVAPASANYYLTAVSFTTGNTNAIMAFDISGITGTENVTYNLHDKLVLNNLLDVDTISNTPQDGDFLIFDSSTSTWYASGITEDSLIAGDGISFDTGTVGQVTINSILAGTGGTWIASDGLNSTHVEYTDTVVIQGTGDVSVTLVTGATTQRYTISNSSTANVDSVSATSGLTTFGNTTGDVIVGHVNNYGTVNIDTSGVEVIDTLLTDTYGHVTGATKRSITGAELDTALQHRYVSISGDTMTGELIINVGSGNQALTTQGDVTINGDLYVSGTTVTVDAENLAITDNIIVINSGQTGNGVSRGTAGIMVDRGDFIEYVFIFDENSDTFRIGETSSTVDDNIISTGSTQAVATREDNPNSYGIAYWSNVDTMFKTTPEPTNGDDGYVLSWNSGNSAWEYVDVQSTISGVYSWSTIDTDGTSITTSSSNDTFTIAGGNGLTTNGSSSTITINHDTVTVSTTNLGSNKIITDVTTDTTGHITNFTTSDVDFSSLHYYKTFTTDSGGPVAASSTDDTIAIVGGNMIETVGSTDTITFNHETISNTNVSLGDNEYINGLTFDNYGHITATSTAKSELFISGDTGTSVDALLNNGIYISGGTGISTEMVNNTLVINSETSELQYNVTLGGTSTTLTDPDFTGAKVVIIDYIINSGNAGSEQEGQLRYLVTSDTITNDYQGDLDISFSDASLSSSDLILTHDNSTYSFDYVVKLIL